ncbi:MAG: DUF1640 domain-containing protein [Bacteroidota bacterium]|nr:DUF1640 domain-containing protein [Bacteroidota bacterium]MXW13788.1 DUF1640 domain-containing protein [Rhodothermaceae bacterium]MDE2646067.1 DUF1640 domain-containing protein [Bacteroidota bacterium]MXW32299.1 DUF1640 domain-containing protein [Rhodothermaceae bacterium]MYC03366.1 DUF1640 domain-containing protein [Rhodothermaceae bacterium]
MIDTLSIVRKLSDSGVKREQAEAHAEAIADAIHQQYGELATKDFVRNQISIVRGEISDLRGDMNTMEGNLRGEINTKVSALDAKISALETRLVYWIVGTGLVVVGLCGTALTIFLNIYGGGSP